jgi:hypothetical protein
VRIGFKKGIAYEQGSILDMKQTIKVEVKKVEQ